MEHNYHGYDAQSVEVVVFGEPNPKEGDQGASRLSI